MANQRHAQAGGGTRTDGGTAGGLPVTEHERDGGGRTAAQVGSRAAPPLQRRRFLPLKVKRLRRHP